MTIFVDDLVEYGPDRFRGGLWCHMWTNGDDAELDDFAQRLGLKVRWAHNSRGGIVGRFYHYDLRPPKRNLAFKLGAVYKPLKQYIQEHIDAKE